ncbi:MAG: hypothetical protein ACXVZM_06760 [Terriglobales bacterium]
MASEKRALKPIEPLKPAATSFHMGTSAFEMRPHRTILSLTIANLAGLTKMQAELFPC